MKRYPNILDIVQAVTSVAPDHPDVDVWWYVPAARFQLRGEGTEEATHVEIVLEAEDTDRLDFDLIGSALSDRLWGCPVRIRMHQGAGAEGRLVRLLTTQQV